MKLQCKTFSAGLYCHNKHKRKDSEITFALTVNSTGNIPNDDEFPPSLMLLPLNLVLYPNKSFNLSSCLNTGLGRRWESITNCIISKCILLWNFSILPKLDCSQHKLNSQSLKNFLCRFSQSKGIRTISLLASIEARAQLEIFSHFKATKMEKMPSFCLVSILRCQFSFQ